MLEYFRSFRIFFPAYALQRQPISWWNSVKLRVPGSPVSNIFTRTSYYLPYNFSKQNIPNIFGEQTAKVEKSQCLDFCSQIWRRGSGLPGLTGHILMGPGHGQQFHRRAGKPSTWWVRPPVNHFLEKQMKWAWILVFRLVMGHVSKHPLWRRIRQVVQARFV